MCQQCVEIQVAYQQESARLSTAQRELAAYRTADDRNSFHRLWTETESVLRQVWRLRLEMASHTASHAEGSLSVSA
jgi:hypothetical protein